MRLAVCAALFGAIAAGPTYTFSLQPLPAGLTPNAACAAAVGGQAANVMDDNSTAIASLIFGSLGSGSMAAVGAWYDQTYGGGCMMGIVSSTSASLALHVFESCPAGSMVVCSTPSTPYGYSATGGTSTVVTTTTATQTLSSTHFTTLPTVTATTTTTTEVSVASTITTSMVSPTATYPVPTSTVLSSDAQYVLLQAAGDQVPYAQAESKCESYGMRLAYIEDVTSLNFGPIMTDFNAWVAPYSPSSGVLLTKVGGTSDGSGVIGTTEIQSYDIVTNMIMVLPSNVMCMTSDTSGGQDYTLLTNQPAISSMTLANSACIAAGRVLASLPGIIPFPDVIPAGFANFNAWAQVNSPTNFVCGYWEYHAVLFESLLRLAWDPSVCTAIATGSPICMAGANG